MADTEPTVDDTAFDLSLKKKKKKKKTTSLDLEDDTEELTEKTASLTLSETTAPPPAAEEGDLALAGKKKKKKKPAAEDAAAAESEEAGSAPASAAPEDAGAAAENPDDLGLGAKKKKKKKKPVEDAEEAVAAAEAAENDFLGGGDDSGANNAAAAAADDGEELDLSNLKKKKKKKKPVEGAEAAEEDDGMFGDTDGASGAVSSSGNEAWLGSDRDYTYTELLQRAFDIMRAKNPQAAVGEKRKFVMKPPQVARIGTKKCALSNFLEICNLMHRSTEHVLSFILAELGTTGSIDSNNQLVIKGRFQQKQMENVLRHYIREYVTCHTCKSPQTNLTKENRLSFLQCETCGSSCSVAAIKAGFQAITTKRAQMRAN